MGLAVATWFLCQTGSPEIAGSNPTGDPGFFTIPFTTLLLFFKIVPGVYIFSFQTIGFGKKSIRNDPGDIVLQSLNT